MIRIREIQSSEYHVLSDFLYEAIYVPEGPAPPKEIINRPELQVYIADFGRKKDDLGLVAEDGHRIVGAVWSRIMNDYGHVDDETPSIAISVYKDYRNHGTGTGLLQNMLGILKRNGYRQVSLSVQKSNYAVRMYQKAGFEIVDEKEEEYIMISGCKEKESLTRNRKRFLKKMR